MKSKSARLRFAALVSLVFVFCAQPADADGPYRAIKVSWTPPTENADGTPLTDLLGYYVYSGLSAQTLTPMFFAPSGSSSIEFLYPEAGTYYFAMTAVNNEGVESALAGPVSTAAP